MNDCGFESGRGSAHDYTPEWMTIPKLYETENEDDSPVIIKLFAPAGSWTWYIIEWNPEDNVCFGLVDGFEEELGYFSLDELSEVRGKLGLRIERDLHFKPRPLSKVRRN